MRFLTVIALIICGVATAGQERPVALPENYKVQFENVWVKVTAVRYEPLQKLSGHTHTPNPSAYVYLNDGPPVMFRHIGGHNMVATRPATKAGAFRVYRGLDEVHEVENTGNSPSEFLRVELKTMDVSPDTFRGKFERPLVPAPEPVVHVDHPQLRISRVWVLPGQKGDIATSAEPALVIALKPGAGFKTGEVRWVPPSSTMRVKNTTTEALDFLRFDFKTPALATR